MRLQIVAAACLMIVVSQPTLAAWAVAQSGNGQPYLQRYRTSEMAHGAVMDACNQSNQSCRLVISGDSGCAAIATTGNEWTVAKAGSGSRASAAALGTCEDLNAGACKIEHQFCGQ